MRVTRAADRKRCLEAAKSLAERLGAKCWVVAVGREARLHIHHRSGVGVCVSWSGDSSLPCHVLSWHQHGLSIGPKFRLGCFHSVNPYHGRKATDTIDQANLETLLHMRLTSLANGDAFEQEH